MKKDRKVYNFSEGFNRKFIDFIKPKSEKVIFIEIKFKTNQFRVTLSHRDSSDKNNNSKLIVKEA